MLLGTVHSRYVKSKRKKRKKRKEEEGERRTCAAALCFIDGVLWGI